MTAFPRQNAKSVLFVTLDSLRYDTAAKDPDQPGLGPPVRAMAPGHFTFASHAAMWVGATPGVPGLGRPFLDPKWARLFRMVNNRIPAREGDGFSLPGRNIVEGFGRLGYRTIGTGAVDWFDPETPTGAWLVQDFQRFFFPGRTAAIDAQLLWLGEQLAGTTGPAFVFLNAGETHVPYFHEGAPWSPRENPCVPFGTRNDRATCEHRQRACFEFVAASLAPLLDAFADGTTLVTADHGDCWGDDGLWEHGTWHPKTMEVPLWLRVRGAAWSQPLSPGGTAP
jgi:hypothetical protein